MAKISGILLAAGASTRFGSSKLLQPLANGEAVGTAAAKTLREVLPDTVVVVRPEDKELIDVLLSLDFKVLENSHAQNGMASSLVEGIKATGKSDGWLIALADMPWVKPETIEALKQQLLKGSSMVAPVYKGTRGNPVGFSTKWKDQLMKLQGDKGARDLLAKYASELFLVDTDDQGVLMDIDYPTDLNSGDLNSGDLNKR